LATETAWRARCGAAAAACADRSADDAVDVIEIASHRRRSLEAWIKQDLDRDASLRIGLHDLNAEAVDLGRALIDRGDLRAGPQRRPRWPGVQS
jgi:hypothetical protein